MPNHPFETQVDMVIISMALHNFIWRTTSDDTAFLIIVANLDFVPQEESENNVQNEDKNPTSSMDDIRDRIALSLCG